MSYWNLTGTYHGYIHSGAKEAEAGIPYSIMNIEPARMPTYLGASEFVINLERSQEFSARFRKCRRRYPDDAPLYKGLLTPYRDSMFILFLRRYPHMRIHLLRQRSTQDGEIILEGTGLEPPIMPDEPPPEIWHPNFDIRYVRVSDTL